MAKLISSLRAFARRPRRNEPRVVGQSHDGEMSTDVPVAGPPHPAVLMPRPGPGAQRTGCCHSCTGGLADRKTIPGTAG